MGFVVEEHLNESESLTMMEKKDQAVVYGKAEYMWQVGTLSFSLSRRLRGLAIVCQTTDHYHPCSNLGMGISEGCFMFDFASLPSEVTHSI